MTCSGCTRYKAKRIPRNNCPTCWNRYFHNNAGRTMAIQSAIQKYGRDVAICVLGAKLVKFYERYVLNAE